MRKIVDKIFANKSEVEREILTYVFTSMAIGMVIAFATTFATVAVMVLTGSVRASGYTILGGSIIGTIISEIRDRKRNKGDVKNK